MPVTYKGIGLRVSREYGIREYIIHGLERDHILPFPTASKLKGICFAEFDFKAKGFRLSG